MKKLYGIGIGPGDKELITLKAYNLIRECDYIFIPQSKGESLAGKITSDYVTDKKVIELEFPMGEDNGERYKNAAEKINEILKDGERGTFLTLGDPMTYSTYIYLMLELKKKNVEVETIPGITSFNAAASRLGIPLTLRDESFYLADGSVDEEILKRVNTVCILKISKNKHETIERLEKHGFSYIYVKRCTQENETIIYDKEEMLRDMDYMSLIFARRIN
ncbi:cobalt-precorrin-2 C(20)-methyltransferase [Fervidicella metallireducens AeB]|uniref:Cobalt-precorrin-2 C(20)-methyltransferase n=1 Tax=Fervidicella metallireducens AeB TaxID=1403537 RepID=A0A017RWS4_9CLOT|nr:precorrin-2 C(20)-methyltransferase [Fervidicella metallireducens]EYE89228.1 cobalt-precorrin-2 C(20)-methyltransferase [Fervidicella metallireducens AeB]